MIPKILPSAFADLTAGRDFYDSQGIGIGTYFLETVFAEIESLRLYAGIHEKKFGFHRLLVSKFPYAVYYKIEGEEAIIYRVLDCRSNPARHRDALTEEIQ
ncbi:MAG: type II toxin-antitoxin system RelE/ParE family toxin [Candidatus Electrothrix sp. AW1]|nr:type II toxin-antitoxin system RelE/ParE family toxin [Candidatus Electrothrix sp. AX1]MCI5181732.1 type II toxin-antitoxin system RelE/ParE family toxin [Candidatus Electrothrix gigas]